MPAADPRVYVAHIRDCCARLLECQALRDKGGIPEAILLAAACRDLEIIGEASNKAGPAFRAAHPEIPWRPMIGTRNMLIHGYEQADPEIVWGIVERDIRPLLAAVRHLLEAEAGPE